MERLTVNFAAKLEGNTLSGVAHVFGQQTLRNGKYETFASTAFDKALSSPVSDVRAFYNHDTSMLLGAQHAGTLRVAREDNNLSFSVDLPDTSYAQDLKALVARGDLNGCSFGFVPGKSEMSRATDGTQVRTHTEVREFLDISPVALPAFNGTSIQLRSLAEPETPQSQAVRARARVRRTHEDN